MSEKLQEMKDLVTPLENYKLKTGFHAEFKVHWAVRDDKEKVLGHGENNVCFSELKPRMLELIQQKKNPCKIQYDFKHYLPVETAERFLELGKEHGLYPSRTSTQKTAEKGRLYLSLKNRSQSRIYWMLCYTRHLRDNPYIVISLVKLVDEYKVAFWPAFYYVICNLSNTSGHNFMPMYKYVTTTAGALRVKATYIHSLHKIFTRQEEQKDHRPDWNHMWNKEVTGAGGYGQWKNSSSHYAPPNYSSEEWTPDSLIHTESFLHPLFAEFLTLDDPQGKRGKEICKDLYDRMQRHLKGKKNG